jgi:GxxExxY protein
MNSQSFAENLKSARKNISMTENELSYQIRGAAFKVHSELGPGLLESVYEMALTYELQQLRLDVKNQLGIPMVYAGIKFDAGFRLDILVNNLVIIEIKSVESLTDIHHKQLLTYLKLSGKKLGLLINFNALSLKDSIIRIVNKL